MEYKRQLGSYFRAISNALGQNLQRSMDAFGLTATQNMFLHHLWFRQNKLGLSTYAKDLEEFFDIKHPTVSGILQRMEAAGFLELRPSPTDRRCKSIHLTEKAEAAHAQAEQHILQTENLLTQGMTEEEISELRRLLQITARNLGVCMPCHSQPKEEPHP